MHGIIYQISDKPIGESDYLRIDNIVAGEMASISYVYDNNEDGREHDIKFLLDHLTEPIPTWALCYLINGDSTSLTDEEVALIDKWYADNKVQTISTASEDEGNCYPYFCNFPAFGLPSEVIDCIVMTL